MPKSLPTTCTECGTGTLVPRASGFAACDSCGKLHVGELDPSAAARKREAGATLGDGIDPAEVRVPDTFEELIGWRTWQVALDLGVGELPILRSVTYSSQFWTPREAVEATCERTSHKGYEAHPVPVQSCSCGLYSAKTLEHLQSMNYHRYDPDAGSVAVVGSVSLWGKVIEGTQGWRAQFGYPRELFVPFEAFRLVKPLTEAYGVPVKLMNILDRKRG